MKFKPLRLLVWALLVWGGTNAIQAARPNVILIMPDDMGIGDFGATGNAIIETPNIDALAGQSVSMKQFYVSPVCSPTRACLMTGRYNYRTRCIDTWVGRSMMEPEEFTVAEALAGAGYATGIFGKWHLGDCYPMRAIDQGFEEALIHKGGGIAQPSEPRENERRYTDPILFHNGKQVETKGYCTDVYFDAAIEFIRRAKGAGRNFFVYLPPNAPHGPFHDVPEDLRKHYMEKDLASLVVGERNPEAMKREVDRVARVAAMITNIDQNVGRLMEALKKLGLVENTMVVFLIDNGPNSRRYVGELRGQKAGVHEGGIRSPLWVHWPAELKPGTIEEPMGAHIDLMPTILDACGVQPPETVAFDGRSLMSLFRREKTEWPERTLTIQTHRGDKPVRYHHFMIRDNQYKLVHPSGFGRERFTGEPKFELYDLQADPGETNNLATDKPEVLKRLRDAYDQWFDDVSTTRPGNYDPPRIHVGTKHEPESILTRQDWRGGTWNRNAIGYWELLITRDGTYAVTLMFDAGKEDEIVELKLGGVTHKTKVVAGTQKHQFKGLQVKEGATRLEARLIGKDQARGIYQAMVAGMTDD